MNFIAKILSDSHCFKILKRSVLFVVVMQYSLNISAQQTFRRHFLIAYDVSTPFMRDQKNCPAFQAALENLFANQTINGFNEANQDNLLTERNNNVVFFDEKRDEISFFHFNIAQSEFETLRWIANNYSNEQRHISSFTAHFIKDRVFNWSEYRNEQTTSTAKYIRTALSLQPKPAVFGKYGVSMSNFVYPLILDKMKNNSCAEEYVLILLSDFLTGAMLGNTKDLNRVRDIYQVSYNATLSPTSPVTYIKKRIDYLASQYYKLDYFQYSFLTSQNDNWDDKQIAIIGLKIKPKIGVLNPEDVALFVDGNLDLDQQGYQSQNFKMSDTKIKFTHNNNLVSTELRMTIWW
ncbi:MAG: hypothetical protein LBC68_12995 [Prevotellaceae bacterium]|jgi:hypothetical protein|nr:hypothetical protein [Prevotellaceae bacterium]